MRPPPLVRGPWRDLSDRMLARRLRGALLPEDVIAALVAARGDQGTAREIHWWIGPIGSRWRGPARP